MKQGDIILVPFPFTDLVSKKTRPALVVSKKCGQDIVAVAITSKSSKNSVKIDDMSLVQGRLPLVSYVLYGKIVTLHTSLVKKAVARVRPAVLEEVVNRVKGLF